MSRTLKLPGTPIFRIFYWLMTLATFALLLYYLIPSKPNIKPVEIDWDDMKISFDQTQRVEAAWIKEAFAQAEQYPLAPPSPLPCPDGLSRVASEIRNPTQQAIEAAKAEKLMEANRILRPLVRNSDHWLPVLTFGILNAQSSEQDAAQLVLENYLKKNQATINEIQSAAVLRQGSTAQSDATVY